MQHGQVLVAIAKVYQVELSDMLALNGLTMDSVIFPGEKLLIKPAAPSPTASPMATATKEATPTRAAPSPTTRPSRTAEVEDGGQILGATAVSMVSTEGEIALSGDGIGSPSALADQGGGVDILLIVIVLLVVFGTGLLLAGSLLKRGA